MWKKKFWYKKPDDIKSSTKYILINFFLNAGLNSLDLFHNYANEMWSQCSSSLRAHKSNSRESWPVSGKNKHCSLKLLFHLIARYMFCITRFVMLNIYIYFYCSTNLWKKLKTFCPGEILPYVKRSNILIATCFEIVYEQAW